jgi:hypothetical protein
VSSYLAYYEYFCLCDDNANVGKPFEFNNVTEMRWIDFRRKLDSVLQPEEGTYKESPRATVLVRESLRQAEGTGLFNDIEITEGELELSWRGSNYEQSIKMFEVDSTLTGQNEPTVSMLEARITVGKFKSKKFFEFTSFLNEYSVGKPGFTYHINQDNELVFLFRIQFNLHNIEEAFRFFLPITWRQHSYAYSVDNLLSDNKRFESYATKEYELDPFVASMLSQEIALMARGEAKSDELISPEGVSIANFFRGESCVDTFKKIASLMNCSSFGYEIEDALSYLRFPLSFGDVDNKSYAECMLEYANSTSIPRIGGVPLVLFEETPPEPVVSFYAGVPGGYGISLSFKSYEDALTAKSLVDLYSAQNANTPIIGNPVVTSDASLYYLRFVEVAYSPAQLPYDNNLECSDSQFYVHISYYFMLASQGAIKLNKISLKEIQNKTFPL